MLLTVTRLRNVGFLSFLEYAGLINKSHFLVPLNFYNFIFNSVYTYSFSLF